MNFNFMNEYISKYKNYFFESDNLDATILRGHLLLEERLNEILFDFVFHDKYLRDAKLKFNQKIDLAKSISLDECDNELWQLVKAISILRNEIAHNLPSEKFEKKIAQVKQLFKNACGMSYEQHWDQEGNIKILQLSVSMCIGFLNAFHEEVKRFKALVKELDKDCNPHRHLKK